MEFRPVLPKRHLDERAVGKELQSYLREFASSVVDEMQRYPAAKPWQQRTGHYGRSWRMQVTRDAAQVINTAAYAAYVSGRRQSQGAKRSGWPKLRETSEAFVKRDKPDIASVVWQRGQ